MQKTMDTRKEAVGRGNDFMRHNAHHEREQARVLVGLILDRGYSVSLNDGEEWTVKRSSDKAAILDAMGSTDSDVLRLRDASDARIADFILIYGNGPGELISDHTANDEAESIWTAFDAECGQ